MKHAELTGSIIGCAMEVHSTLGRGLPEHFYHRAMEVELRLNHLQFEQEKEVILTYKGVNVGTRRIDFYVSDIVLVEIKAVSQLESAHLAQGLNYMETFNGEVGLLLNFGALSLEFKRLHNNRNKIRNSSNGFTNRDLP